MKTISSHLPATLLCIAIAAASMAIGSFLILVGKYTSLMTANPVAIFSWMLNIAVLSFSLSYRHFTKSQKTLSSWQLPVSAIITAFILFTIPVMYLFESNTPMIWLFLVLSTSAVSGFLGGWMGQDSRQLPEPFPTLMVSCAIMGGAIGSVAIGAEWLGTDSAFNLSASLAVVLALVHGLLALSQLLRSQKRGLLQQASAFVAICFFIGTLFVATQSEHIQNNFEQKRLGVVAQ